MNLNPKGLEKDVRGVHVRPSQKLLDDIGWDAVTAMAEFVMDNNDSYPEVDEIKKDPTKVKSVGLSYGESNVLALPFANICGRTIMLMFEEEQPRRTIKDGFHRTRR